jgi:predicted PurR-regulated permease PerM
MTNGWPWDKLLEMTELERGERDRKRRTDVLVLAAAIAAFLPAVYGMAKPFLTAVVLSAILAVAFNPLYSRIGRLVPRASLAAFITTSAAIGPLVIALVFVGMAVNHEIRSGAMADFVRSTGSLAKPLSFDLHTILDALPQLNRIAGSLFTAGFTAVFLHVLLLHGETWLRKLTAMLPVDATINDRILAATRDAIVANVDGILAMAVIEAILFGTILWVAGIASPAILAVLAGLSSMIPLIGAAAAWLPVTITLAIHASWIKAAVFGIVCFATQQAVALLLVPRIVGAQLGQSPLLIVLSILGATSAFGPIGVLVGPVIVSVLGVLVEEFRKQLHPQSGLSASSGRIADVR